MPLKLRLLLVVIIIPASALAVRNQVRHKTTGNTTTTMQDPNWAELMKSVQTMHAAMETAKATGNDDEDFVNLMLPHHEAAVEMAKAELLHGNDPQMRRLAQEIITDQESEIQLMKLWLEQQKAGLKNPHQSQSSGLPREK